jgi:hypothetical protein
VSVHITYHLGGYDPSKPAQNRAEMNDGAAGTYTKRDATGAQIAQRALTADEAAALAAEDARNAADTNGATLRQQAAAALTANRAYVALASPSAAQTTAQVKALSQQNNKIMRLVLGQLDGTD